MGSNDHPCSFETPRESLKKKIKKKKKKKLKRGDEENITKSHCHNDFFFCLFVFDIYIYILPVRVIFWQRKPF